MGKVDGKVAIVTGAAQGMGAAHATALVREGARVLLTDVREDQGRQLAKELGENARFAAHDVTSLADWERAMSTAEREFGNVAILVNNAAIGVAAPTTATTEAEYRRVIDVNQVGTFLGLQAVHPSEVVLFLASDESSFVNGSAYVVDGGFLR